MKLSFRGESLCNLHKWALSTISSLAPRISRQKNLSFRSKRSESLGDFFNFHLIYSLKTDWIRIWKLSSSYIIFCCVCVCQPDCILPLFLIILRNMDCTTGPLTQSIGIVKITKMLGINQQFSCSLTNKKKSIYFRWEQIILSSLNHSYLSKMFAMISRCPQLIDMFSRKPNSIMTPLDNVNTSLLYPMFDHKCGNHWFAQVTVILQDGFGRWYMELSITARVVVYITVLGTISHSYYINICLVLLYSM